ncbi:putative membrane protein [Escherichia coli P0299483.1]|nr:putative membrane protein [Escherichia coli P0299483.1]
MRFLDNRRLSAFAFASAIHEVNFLSLVVPAPPETDLFVFLTCDFLFFIATSVMLPTY